MTSHQWLLYLGPVEACIILWEHLRNLVSKLKKRQTTISMLQREYNHQSSPFRQVKHRPSWWMLGMWNHNQIFSSRNSCSNHTLRTTNWPSRRFNCKYLAIKHLRGTTSSSLLYPSYHQLLNLLIPTRSLRRLSSKSCSKCRLKVSNTQPIAKTTGSLPSFSLELLNKWAHCTFLQVQTGKSWKDTNRAKLDILLVVLKT